MTEAGGPASESEPVGPAAAFRSRDFRRFELARLFAVVAFQMLGVAVGWRVYELTGRALDLGLVGLAQFLPMLLLALVAGQVADRYDRRRVVGACHAVLAFAAGALVFAAKPGGGSVALVYALLVLVGTARAFSGPAGQALLPNLVPLAHFPNAVAWNAGIFHVAVVLGPALGGMLYGPLGAERLFALCAGLELVAVLLLFGIRPTPPRPGLGQATPGEFVAGLRYVWNNRVILGALSLDLFAILLGGAVALLPVFARDMLDVGPGGLGVLRSAPAFGATVIAVVLAYRPLRSHVGAMMYGCVFAFGCAMIVFGLSKSYALSVAALLVAGAVDMVSVMVRQTLVQLRTPDEMRGRVAAVNVLFIGASNELGEFESGLTAEWLGAGPAVVLGGVGTCIVVLLWLVLFPELARVKRLT